MISKIENFNTHPQHRIDYEQVMQEIWPKIILQSTVVKEYYDQLFKLFPDYQKVCLNSNNELIGFINTIPFYWEKDLKELPEQGWDWLIQKGIADIKNGISPNCLGGLQIGIKKAYQGQGLSRKIVAIGKSIQQENRFKKFILPIRPTLKHIYPSMPMEEYMLLKKDGIIFDPWIRIHESSGAKIIKVCHESMVIDGTINDWETLSGKKINVSGNCIIDGALNEVQMNLETNQGLYKEDNIWLYYAK